MVKNLRLPFEREDAINGFSSSPTCPVNTHLEHCKHALGPEDVEAYADMHGVHAGDQLLQKKAYKELLEPYDSRAQEAADYIKAVRPGLEVQTGALLDPKVVTPPAGFSFNQICVHSSPAQLLHQHYPGRRPEMGRRAL